MSVSAKAKARVDALRAKHEQELRERSLTMMRTPNDWPTWPKLPVKRQREQDVSANNPLGQLGVMFELPLSSPPRASARVHLCTIFEGISGKDFIDYKDLEAVIADGWVVD